MHSKTGRLTEATPDFLQGFLSSDGPGLSEESGLSTAGCMVKQIACLCGCDLLHVKVVQAKQLRGVCSKAEFVDYRPPVYLVCSACKKSKLLFDPVVHGWKGELGLIRDDEQLLPLTSYRYEPGRILVAYDYAEKDEHQALLASGIEDLENYFCSLIVFFRPASGSAWLRVFHHSCQ